MTENQKKQPVKRIQLVDVVRERKESQLFCSRRVRSPKDAVKLFYLMYKKGNFGYGQNGYLFRTTGQLKPEQNEEK